MRQWLVNPKILCKNHLLGEHLENHMFCNGINRKISLFGYLQNNLLEPSSLEKRHDELVKEMLRRGYNHKSPFKRCNTSHLGINLYHQIDKEASLKDLILRCKECRIR